MGLYKKDTYAKSIVMGYLERISVEAAEIGKEKKQYSTCLTYAMYYIWDERVIYYFKDLHKLCGADMGSLNNIHWELQMVSVASLWTHLA